MGALSCNNWILKNCRHIWKCHDFKSDLWTNLLAKHGFTVYVLAYVKDVRSNIFTMTFALTSIMSCEVLGLLTPFVGACWGHAMFKHC
jgi:hypothetical protein